MDIQRIRDDFYILKNSSIAYLDNAASSLTPKPVIDAITDYYERLGSVNVHRGVYRLSYEATRRYEEARYKVAEWINGKPNEIIFTRGASSALNLVALSYGMRYLEPGDEIITSELEHHSSLLPWQQVARKKGARLVYVPLNEEGRITVENFQKVLSDRTKVVALTYVSNVLGYVTPIAEIIRLAHAKGAIVVVDAAQAVPHFRVDVKALDCDFLAFSGHKMCGPSGIGVLYGKYELLQNMDPIEFGGEMIDYVYLHDATFKDAPYKFEAGTPPIAGAIGLGAAIDYLQSIGYEFIQRQEQHLMAYTRERIKDFDYVEVYNRMNGTGILAFNIKGVHAHDAATVFDQYDVALRAGHHCAQPLMQCLKQVATLRASFYFYNTEEDADKLIIGMQKVREFFSRYEES